MLDWQDISTAPKDRWVLLKGGSTDEWFYAEPNKEGVTADTFRPVTAKWLEDDNYAGPRWGCGHWDGEWRTAYEEPTHWAELE